MTVRFIDDNRKDFGVEPICKTLQVAPSTYYAAKSRPASDRSLRDAVMVPVLLVIFQANYSVYGAHKLWKAARRAGYGTGRDQVARLMRQAGVKGVRRGRQVVTTRADKQAGRAPDLVDRQFVATRPNALWVTDLTYVPTWSGVAYACFIVDAFSRMVVGWRVAAHMRAQMVLDALEMARWQRGTYLEGLVAHSDAGSQGGFNRPLQHLDHGGVRWGRCESVSERSSFTEDTFPHREGLESRGVKTGSNSGPQSRVA
jgi:putative transposase